jgi:threonine dehydrogenase-like Zn-dependent dehydrogenase/predicted dehydrogenase
VKQVLQSLKDGTTEVATVPCPRVGPGQVLVRTSRTLISAGTERMLVEFGRAGLVAKARQQPDKVRTVLDKLRTDGPGPTLDALRTRLDQPLALGYCHVGVVAEVGEGVTAFAPGDRVVSNGRHAEFVVVPVNLCARVPDAVPDERAAFTVLAAVALQGIRLVQPTLGESVAVAGLGLIGLAAVQLLRACGCRVIGIDFDRDRLDLAKQFGAEVADLSAGQDPVAAAREFSRGRGVDAVLIAASTRSSEPVHQAAGMCRQRGRVVLVGVTGLELSRDDFYRKELTFQVSSSYGPGRYDPVYEEKGQDYPFGFVRWTEQRNFEAVLDMMADGRFDPSPFVSHRFPIDEAARAYDLVAGDDPSLGILLEYPAPDAAPPARTVPLARPDAGGRAGSGSVAVSFVGAGNYATAILVDAFKRAGASLRYTVSGSGVSGLHAGRRFGFAGTTTDPDEVFGDAGTTAVVVATRHDTHAQLAVRALRAGKPVFVEKPLCLTLAELEEIDAAYRERAGVAPPLLAVGFNRRFAPHVVRLKALIDGVRGPKSFVMTVNAGAIPADHWTQDETVGGGRILGEGCHFVDLLRFLAGVPITGFELARMAAATRDTATIQLAFADGSIGSIHYFANGSKRFPKERLEVFAGGRVLQLDNYRRLVGFGWPGFTSMRLWRQDKGQRACAAAFVRAVLAGDASPIPFDEIVEVSRVSIELARAAGRRA